MVQTEAEGHDRARQDQNRRDRCGRAGQTLCYGFSAKGLDSRCADSFAAAAGGAQNSARPAARSPGSLKTVYQRIAACPGEHIAAVATARKLAMILWHMLTKQTDRIWVRPALLAQAEDDKPVSRRAGRALKTGHRIRLQHPRKESCRALASGGHRTPRHTLLLARAKHAGKAPTNRMKAFATTSVPPGFPCRETSRSTRFG